MGKLGEAKIFGGIGSILIILSAIPYGGFVIGIAGFVLVLIAVKYISDYLNDQKIFNNMLIAVILAIVGIVVAYMLIFGYFVASFLNLGSMLQGTATGPAMGFFTTALLVILLSIVTAWIFMLISALFIRRSYIAIADKLGISLFNTVALLYLIGSALTIVLVGFIIIFIAEILQAVAFFSIEEQPSSQASNIPE